MKNKQTYKPNTKDYILKEHLSCQLYLSNGGGGGTTTTKKNIWFREENKEFMKFLDINDKHPQFQTCGMQ